MARGQTETRFSPLYGAHPSSMAAAERRTVQHLMGGTVITEYQVDGQLHRDRGPAYIEKRPDGSRVEKYYRNGKLHRGYGMPAIIMRLTPDGFQVGVSVDQYYIDGVRQSKSAKRTNGSSTECRYQEGKLCWRLDVEDDGTRVEEYIDAEGNTHRDEGPAMIETAPDGCQTVNYYRHGVLHRDDGPARIFFNPDGSVRRRSFYRDGKHIKI